MNLFVMYAFVYIITISALLPNILQDSIGLHNHQTKTSYETHHTKHPTRNKRINEKQKRKERKKQKRWKNTFLLILENIYPSVIWSASPILNSDVSAAAIWNRITRGRIVSGVVAYPSWPIWMERHASFWTRRGHFPNVLQAARSQMLLYSVKTL